MPTLYPLLCVATVREHTEVVIIRFMRTFLTLESIRPFGGMLVPVALPVSIGIKALGFDKAGLELCRNESQDDNKAHGSLLSTQTWIQLRDSAGQWEQEDHFLLWWRQLAGWAQLALRTGEAKCALLCGSCVPGESIWWPSHPRCHAGAARLWPCLGVHASSRPAVVYWLWTNA